MPARDPVVRRIAADLGNTARHNGPDDPRLVELRRDLRAAKLEERVRRDVDTWPPLTADQRARLAALLQGGAG